MKYNIESLDSALDVLLPNIKKAKEGGITFNRPSLLDMVAKEFFINSLNREWNPSFDERLAYFICQEACYDLHEKGFMDFGKKLWTYEQHSNKLNIAESKLYKEVSSVIGKVDALKELTRAYREYIPTPDYPFFNWQEGLLVAFEWEKTPQGDDYWCDIWEKGTDT